MMDLPQEADRPAEVISVEASRIEEQARLGIFGESSIFETPYTVNSYDKEQIEAQSSVSANQVLKNDPALTNVSAAGGFSGFTLSFRGFPSGADAVSFNGLGPGAMFSGSLGQLYSVERIDVVKGPSTALGAFSPQASVGGSVSIIPKKALDRPLTSFSLGYREKGIVSGHADISRKLSESLAVRVNLAAEKGQTFYRGTDERRVAALALSYKISDSMKLDLGYDVIHVRSEGYQNAFVLASGVKLPKAPNPLQQHFQRWSYLEQEWNYGYGSFEWRLPANTTFTLDAIQGVRRRPILSTGTGLIVSDSGNMILRPSYLAPGTVYDPFYGANAIVRTRQDTGPIRHDLSLAFLYSGFDFKNAISAPLANIQSNLYHPRYVDRPTLTELKTGRVSEVDMRTYALTDNLHFAEDWDLLLGAKNTTLSVDNFDVDSGRKTLRQNDTVTSPIGALSYRIRPDLTSYISFAEGLEKGGVAPTGSANANEIMPSLLSRQWELGSKWKLGDAALLSASLFEIERKLEYLDADSNVYVQDGLQRNKGVELSLQGHLNPRLQMTVGAMALDAKVVKSGTIRGKRPPGVPNWTLPLLVDYEVSSGLTATVGLYHFDRQYVDAANTQRLKEWTRYDAGLTQRLPFEAYRLSLSAYVENIGNQRYWSSASGGQLALGGPEIWKFALRAEI